MAYEDLARLRRQAASSGHYSDMLRYRDALKRSGTGQAVLDLQLPHKWQVVGADRKESYAAVRKLLTQLCYDDQGLQPFFGSKARPLTFKETIQARMDQWRESGGKDWSLWETSLSTSTAIVYDQQNRYFKIMSLSPELLSASFAAVSSSVDYADLPGPSLPIDTTYNRELIMEEAIVHQGWLAALEGDSELLRQYAAVAADRSGDGNPFMGFYLEGAVWRKEVQSLTVDDCHDVNAVALGLFNPARFARICPP